MPNSNCKTQCAQRNCNEVVKQTGNKIVRTRLNSKSELMALFAVLTQPPRPDPLKSRNLPKNFFEPPLTGTKSPPLRSCSALPASGIHHSRAYSSPATLQQTLVDGKEQQQQQQQQHQQHQQQQHFKQQSCDFTLEYYPLPDGWEQAKTQHGQVYFLK